VSEPRPKLLTRQALRRLKAVADYLPPIHLAGAHGYVEGVEDGYAEAAGHVRAVLARVLRRETGAKP